MIQPTLIGIDPVKQTEVIDITVPCVPKGQPRTRTQAGISKAGNAFARHYTPDTADAFKRAIQLCAARLRGRRHEGPLRISAVAYFPRTEKVWRKHPRTKVLQLIEINHLPPGAPDEAVPMWVKPDRDNVDKAMLDALGGIGLFEAGDEQVFAGAIEKWWTAKGAQPGVRIRIELIPLPEWAKKRTKRRK